MGRRMCGGREVTRGGIVGSASGSLAGGAVYSPPFEKVARAKARLCKEVGGERVGHVKAQRATRRKLCKERGGERGAHAKAQRRKEQKGAS
jgi:hypothetical protein